MTTPMAHCEACPLDPGVECPSDSHPSWCRNAAKERTRPDPRQHYWLGRIRELAGIAREPVAGTPGPPARAARPRTIGTDARLAMAAELCECGSGPCGCGNGPPRSCSHPDRPAEVRRADCLTCRARDLWEAAG